MILSIKEIESKQKTYVETNCTTLEIAMKKYNQSLYERGKLTFVKVKNKIWFKGFTWFEIELV